MLAQVTPIISNEGANAIVIAIIGSVTSLLVARWQANKQQKKEDTDDGRAFRGELRDDNKSLREEIRELKADRETSRTYILTLEKELAALAEERNTREQADRITANRPTILAPKSVGQGS
jgi:predicted nuclease with TOPRIM domain